MSRGEIKPETWQQGQSWKVGWISPSGGLTFSALQAIDTIGTGYFLNGGSAGFSSPTTIGGFWEVKATPPASVPDHGPSTAGLMAVLGLSWIAVRVRDANRRSV